MYTRKYITLQKKIIGNLRDLESAGISDGKRMSPSNPKNNPEGWYS